MICKLEVVSHSSNINVILFVQMGAFLDCISYYMYLIPTDIPKNMPEAKKAALETFDRYCAIMQNYVDPRVMNDLFEKHKVFSDGVSPITGLAKELHLRVQMNYMLDNIRKHIGATNAEIFYNLVCSFQAVPEYKILAIHLEGQLFVCTKTICMYVCVYTSENSKACTLYVCTSLSRLYVLLYFMIHIL